MSTVLVRVLMAAWSDRDVPTLTGSFRCYALEADDLDTALEALADAGLVEEFDPDLMRAMAMRPTSKTSAAIITVAELLRSPDGNHEWESSDSRWLSMPDGDYEAALAALQWAGFTQVECPPISE